MSKKNIVDALEGISNAISGGGSASSGDSGNSGLGFTLVYFEPYGELTTSLMAVKNGNLVPFTVTDLLGESVQDAIKTVPILLFQPGGGDPDFICNMAAIACKFDTTVLVFSATEGARIAFRANEDSNYAFVSLEDSDDDDDDPDNPAAY